MTNSNGSSVPRAVAVPIAGHTDPVPIEEFLSWKPVMPKEILGKGILYAGGKAIVYGRYKRFKSMLILWAMQRMRDGQDVLGIPTPVSGVSSLYLQSEISEPLLHKRMVKMYGGVTPGANAQSVYMWNKTTLKLDTEQGYDEVRQWLSKLNVDLLIIDPLYKFLSGDITSPAAVTPFQDNVDRLIAEFGIGVLIVAHPRKGGVEKDTDRDDTDDLLGSSTWNNWPDAVLKVVIPPTAPTDVFVLKLDTLRHAEEEIPNIAYTVNRQTLQFKTTVLV